MRWPKLSLFAALVAGSLCAVAAEPMPHAVDVRVAPADAAVDLSYLWSLTLANNPALREATADVEVARGKRLQAGLYPNPRLAYSEETLGSARGGAGVLSLQVTQEFVTGGKRHLEMAAASQGTSIAALALTSRKFEVLTHLRRGWYDFLAWTEAVRGYDEVVAALEQSVEITRQLVEVVKTRPRSDLLRLQALLEEARSGQARSRISRAAAWRQLVAEIGIPDLTLPAVVPRLPPRLPQWDEEAVLQRVLASNAGLHQAALEVNRAQLEYQRARAEAVPNLQVGGGYVRDFIEETGGAIVSLETSLPLWDRKQGQIYEARARWARAEAALRSTANRLTRDTIEAFARCQSARQQVEYLTAGVLPRLEESLRLVRQGYQAGDTTQTFADVQQVVETLNDTKLKLVEARRALWQAVADLQGLMQVDICEQ